MAANKTSCLSSKAFHLRTHCCVKIIEEPQQRTPFFYGQSVPIFGISSSPQKKTFPSIRLDGYIGRAKVVVSCVTKDEPYRPHPFNLVGEKDCNDGVCTLMIPKETMKLQLSDIRLQLVTRREIKASLTSREEGKVDPFSTGFHHKNDPNSIDLNAVRLCFQVYLEGDVNGDYSIPLKPKVSQPIFNEISKFSIVKLSECSYPVDADKELILLCKKVDKEDIKIRFFEKKNGRVTWESYADFSPSQVHYRTAISFKPPQYHNRNIKEGVNVFVQLVRPSDGFESEPLAFEFLPVNASRHKLETNTNPYLTSNMKRLFHIFSQDLPFKPATIHRVPSFDDEVTLSNIYCERSPYPSTGSGSSDEDLEFDSLLPVNVSCAHHMPSAERTFPLKQHEGIEYASKTSISSCQPILSKTISDLDHMTSYSPDKNYNVFHCDDGISSDNERMIHLQDALMDLQQYELNDNWTF